MLPSTLFSPAVIAVVTVAYLSMRGVINWEDVKGISWGFLFIIGAGLSLGEALSRTGATDWFANLIGPIIIQPPVLVSLLFLVLLSALLTNVINNATVAVVFVPMLINIAQSSSAFTPLQLVLPVAFATTFGYSLPSASGRMALISTLGIIDRKEMIRCGLVLTVISSIILAVFFYSLLILNWI
jgi:sodium-dependent dicarboxylate transporter 2/3/5